MSTVDDAYDRHTDSEWDEHLRHVEQSRTERFRERSGFAGPDWKPAKTVKKPLVSGYSHQRFDWKVAVTDRDQGCYFANPAGCEMPLQCHHVIPQQVLRREGKERWLWDARVGMAVCAKHHRQHHNRVRPIFINEIPVAVREFIVSTLEMGDYLERHYPARFLTGRDPGDESEAA